MKRLQKNKEYALVLKSLVWVMKLAGTLSRMLLLKELLSKPTVMDMTRKYQTNNPMSPSFMSINTFLKWFFGWMSNMKLDFRKEIDPVCGYNPKILACDGTHIGVSIKHLHLDKPVT